MKRITSVFVAGTLIISTLSACQQNQSGQIDKQTMGTVVGAGAGALLGAQVGKGSGRIAATAVGTLLGAALGNSVGASLDRADMAYYNNTSQAALENNRTGVPSNWSNPDSGNSGTITPTRTYEVSGGEYCREYSQTINVGGKSERAYGTACRQSDGTWKIVE
ncbi:MAG: hypothetical protein COV36_06500 [Alphaproteobacteria bacterium CG11_big_fil_rev_8_21_14_0_20_44_7]|nr:MAG: hypothetical protein COV36_06500 [Alphaproteobacteria bacterium CG11_big_fil_rev_8_21_14_0_20_44_7]